MEEKIEGWNPTCNRFVAFLDIIGFKDMVLRNSHLEVYNILKSFQPTIQKIEEHAKSFLDGKAIIINEEGKEDKSPIVRSVLFSDSIILISNGDSLLSASYMFLHVGQILYDALIKRIPMKGAIAYGEQTADFEKSLHFGRPLVDAFELQDELQLYGVVLHHTVENYLIKSQNLERSENNYLSKYPVFRYPVPMKKAKITHHVIDWLVFCKDNIEPIELVHELYNNVSGTPRMYVDNTLEFVRWLIDRRIERYQQKKA